MNLFLAAGGGLMFFFNLSAIAWSGRLGYMNVTVAFTVLEVIGMLGGLFVIAMAIKWNENNNKVFTFIAYFSALLNIAIGAFHGVSWYYFGYGFLIVFSGVLVLLAGGAKFSRYGRDMALGARMSTFDEEEHFEEMQVRSEIRGIEERTGEVIHEVGTRYCVGCEARLPADAAFCIKCGSSQETDY